MQVFYKVLFKDIEVFKSDDFKKILDYIRKNGDQEFEVIKLVMRNIEHDIKAFFENKESDENRRNRCFGYKLKTEFLDEDRKLSSPFELILGISFLGELVKKYQTEGLDDREISLCVANGIKDGFLSSIELKDNI